MGSDLLFPSLKMSLQFLDLFLQFLQFLLLTLIILFLQIKQQTQQTGLLH